VIVALAPALAAAQDFPGFTPGQAAKSFKAVDTDGRPVSFPGDFERRVVLLDFWATWCGPCVGEVPGLVAAYSQYHAKGFDVLGISLDQAKALEGLLAFEEKTGMPWRQIYDGRDWQSRIARFYGIQAIPDPILVDGDTGRIIAAGDSLRGSSLEPSLAKAMKAKGLLP
jgi:thiol-disulfide isomerase/thioredoxin